MNNTVISIEKLSKRYQLGAIGASTLSRDLNRWWAKRRGKPDPYLKIGEVDYGNRVDSTVWALSDVSFDVERGEVLGLIGRNGAGKSTLLKILSQITAPTYGKAKIKGRVGSLLEVGTGFHPELTGRENIFLNGAILGMNRHEVKDKFDEIVEFSGIEKFIDTPVKRYSSGMYVRLAFAVAAHLEPDILIIDEVLAVGDTSFQKKCLGKISDIASGGRTVLFVSHNMHAIDKLTSKCALFDKGHCIELGPTSEVIEVYNKLNEVNTYSIANIGDTQGKVTLVSAVVLTSTGSEIHEFGEELKIEFTLRVEKPVERARLAFTIDNPLNQPVTYAWYYGPQNDYFDMQEGIHIFSCSFPKLHLSLGKYFITLHLSEFQGANKLMQVGNLCYFDVKSTDLEHMFSWGPNHLSYLEQFSWQKR